MNTQSLERGLRRARTLPIPLSSLAPVILLLSSAQGALAQASDRCLLCHTSQGLAITFRNGEQITGFVDSNRLQASVHGALSCQACHTDIPMERHPGAKSESTADFRHKASRACRTCHAEDRLKARPTHAFAAVPGASPPCAECHGGHDVSRVSAWKQALAERDYCLVCHRTPLTKTHRSGEVLPLQVDPDNLGASVHNRQGCTSCHVGFSRGAHPVSVFESDRQHRIQMANACGTCHPDKAARVKGSVHGALSAPAPEGQTRPRGPDVPVCTDCHGFHSVGPRDSYRTLSGVPCRRCHEEVFRVYEASVHGTARAKGEHRAPLCSSCHFAHEIAFTAASGKIKAACLGCHEGVESAHQAWLPNAELHLGVIACSACHAPAAAKGIYLQVVDRDTGLPIPEDRILGLLGTDAAGLATRLDDHGDGLDPSELSFVLKQLNRRGGGVRLSFVGSLDVNRYSEAHQLSLRSSAVKECASCHNKDSTFFKTVNLAIVRADGRLATYRAQPDTLGSLRSARDIGGFYVLGATRVAMLDWLGVLLVAAGALIPIAHIGLRLLTARYRARRATPGTGVAVGGLPVLLHPLAVRVWHWFNATVFLGLLWTGMQLRYQDLAGVAEFKSAVTLHNVLGVAMTVGFAFWLCYYACTGKLRLYVPPFRDPGYLRRVWSQAKYYGFGVFRGDPSPHHSTPDDKFNPLQQLAYLGVMLGLFPVQIGTGILLMDVVRFGGAIELLGGLAVIDAVHVVASFALIAFLCVHVYLVTLGDRPLEHIRSMVTGYKRA
jgi:thiosulfate reductase cytochrome b subunit